MPSSSSLPISVHYICHSSLDSLLYFYNSPLPPTTEILFWHLVSNNLLKWASPNLINAHAIFHRDGWLVEKEGGWEFTFHSIQRTENGVLMTQLVALILTSAQALSLLFPVWAGTHWKNKVTNMLDQLSIRPVTNLLSEVLALQGKGQKQVLPLSTKSMLLFQTSDTPNSVNPR